MQKFDAVLFDLDGTLIDSAPGILATFQKTFEAFGLTVGEQRLRPFLGPPLGYGVEGLWFASTDAILVSVFMRLIGMIAGV